MSSPSSSTRPVIHPSSLSSCIRLSVRRKVDLPQPDGPISACTRFGAKRSDTLFTAVNLPYIAVRRSVSIWMVSAMAAALPGGEPGPDAQDQDHHDEDERRRPGIRMPLLERAGGIGVYRERQRGHRLPDAGDEILAPERREEQRRRLAGDAGHRQEAAGDDARQGGTHHHKERRAPAGIPQR